MASSPGATRRTAGAPALTNDQYRLLAVLDCYTAGGDGEAPKRWLKELAFHMVIFDLITRGVFTHYDFAPVLINVHGVKKFAKISQEAWNDLRYLRKLRLIDRVKLSTHYHEIVGAFRISRAGARALREASGNLIDPLRDKLRCRRCSTYREPMAFAGPPVGHDHDDRNEAIWLCPKCCGRCLARGPVRTFDPRLCEPCPSRDRLLVFALESVHFLTRPHLPTRTDGDVSASRPVAVDRTVADGPESARPLVETGIVRVRTLEELDDEPAEATEPGGGGAGADAPEETTS